MKPDDNLINITPVSEVQKRTEAESCPMTVLSYSNRASVIVSCTTKLPKYWIDFHQPKTDSKCTVLKEW